MATNVNPLDNPLLREVERLSPATSLDLVVDYDDEDWPVYRSFSVGDIVISERGDLYRVQGFTLDDLVLTKPHGLGHNPLTMLVTFYPAGLSHPQDEGYGYRHRDGLVTLIG